MSLFSKIKEGVKSMIGIKDIENKLNVSVAMSTQMQNGIYTWVQMYMGKAPWIHEPDPEDTTRVVSLGLPALIASEKARTALLEFKSEITTPTEEVEEPNPDYKDPPDTELNMWGQEVPKVVPPTIKTDKPVSGVERAEYLNEQYDKLKKELRRKLEYGIAFGGLVIKPYIVTTKDLKGQDVTTIEFDFVRADCFYPLAFNNKGDITECIFIQPRIDKDVTYYRVEYHKWENNTATVINKAYKSNNVKTTMGEMLQAGSFNFGKPIALTEVPEWSALQEKTVIKNIDRPLYAYFRMPEANTLDLTSPLGVSGYSRAKSLIKDADMQYSRLLWEYEAGEMALNVDRDAFRWLTDGDGDHGHSKLGVMQQRLYRQVDIEQGELFEPYAPTLRDTNYTAGLNEILMRIEDVCAISRGTISDVTQEAKTATEIKILKQRSYQANADIQQALESTLRDVVYIMNALCDMYEITPSGEYDVSFEWDDSILVDVDVELQKRITLMQNGLTSKLENRMWYFGETERQAQEALDKINEDNKTEAENDLANFATFAGGEDDTDETPPVKNKKENAKQNKEQEEK